MLKKLSFGLFIVLIASAAVLAQSAYTPEKGAKERTEILNALRVPVEKELKQKIQFTIDHFKVQGNWAFLSGAPQSASGGEPDYSNTEYAEAREAGAFDNNFFALMKKTGGKWRVATYLIGCTDVCFATWWREHKAPKTIFPYTE